MLAVRLQAPGQLSPTDVPRPACPPGGVLVRVLACGLCASDLKMFRLGHKELSLPRVLGHEISGEVAEVGSGVQGLAPGEPVR